MKRPLLTLVLCCIVAACVGCASLKDSTHLATATDAATTLYGVSSGVAQEINPLMTTPAAFVAIMVARIVGTEYVNTLPEPERTAYLSAMSSVWWGFGVSNIAVLLMHSNPVGAGIGLFTTAMWWISTSDRREFAQICANEKLTNPALVCEFKT